MSAEAWRRIGSDLAPLDLAWQAWHFQHLRLDLRGRRGTLGRGTLGTSIDVRGSLATNWVGFGATGSCVAGVTLSAPEARFAWQACYFRYLHRCPWKLGGELGRIWRRYRLRKLGVHGPPMDAELPQSIAAPNPTQFPAKLPRTSMEVPKVARLPRKSSLRR